MYWGLLYNIDIYLMQACSTIEFGPQNERIGFNHGGCLSWLWVFKLRALLSDFERSHVGGITHDDHHLDLLNFSHFPAFHLNLYTMAASRVDRSKKPYSVSSG